MSISILANSIVTLLMLRLFRQILFPFTILTYPAAILCGTFYQCLISEDSFISTMVYALSTNSLLLTSYAHTLILMGASSAMTLLWHSREGRARVGAKVVFFSIPKTPTQSSLPILVGTLIVAGRTGRRERHCLILREGKDCGERCKTFGKMPG